MDTGTRIIGVILAGGKSTRMAGNNKALLPLGKGTVIERTLSAMEGLIEEGIIITNQPQDYLYLDRALLPDLFSVPGPLSGIHAALAYAQGRPVMVLGCDMPFIQPALLGLILDRFAPGADVVIPETRMGLEPLFAIYGPGCLDPVARNIRKGRLKVTGFFDQVRVRRVPEEELRSVDPDLVSFLNINTPGDLADARLRLDRSRETPIAAGMGGIHG